MMKKIVFAALAAASLLCLVGLWGKIVPAWDT